MRRLGHALIVLGLLAALIGEVVALVDRETAFYQVEVDAGHRDTLRLGPPWLSLWSAMGVGAAISGVGVLLVLLRPSRLHRRRRLISSRPGGKDVRNRTDLEH